MQSDTLAPGRWRQQMPTTSINKSGRHAKSLTLGGNNRDQRPHGHSKGGHSVISRLRYDIAQCPVLIRMTFANLNPIS